MNAMAVISGIIVLAMMLDGYRIGLIRSVFSIIKLIVSAAIAALTVYCATTIVPPELKYIIPGIFIAVIGLVFVLAGLIVRMLNIADRIPGVRMVNRLAGIVSGALYGIVCLWILFIVITYFSDTEYGNVLLEMIKDDKTLTFLYNANPFDIIIDKWNILVDLPN